MCAHHQGFIVRVNAVALCVVGTCWLILAVVTFMVALELDESFTLAVLLLLIGIPWIVSGVFMGASNSYSTVVPVQCTSDLGGTLILVGGLTLTAQLSIRLLTSAHFGGHAAGLDFGGKCAYNANQTCAEQNEAFSFAFNSFGHCFQGFLAILLFPIVEHALGERWVLGVQAAGCLVVGYPLYNGFKRALNSSNSFAASSFCQNGAEWAAGFLLSLSSGVLCIARTPREPQPQQPRSSGQGACQTFVLLLRYASGGALCVLTFTVAVLFGITWDNTSAQDKDDPADMVMLVLFIAVPIASLVGLAGTLAGTIAFTDRATSQNAQPVHAAT